MTKCTNALWLSVQNDSLWARVQILVLQSVCGCASVHRDMEYRVRTPAKRIRQERGWTLTEVADATGVSASTISRFERGLLIPSAANLLALAKVYEVEPSVLLDRPELAS